ncbi:hypothetical protein AAEO56_02795 [Flavobacterium sp. DGU11]|uniref:SMODS-associated NUDIX domain-containing protein n=1 Tax=Flavobacterium arundinis TaxID=3139143 RepID=A0ABU9HSP5_9FLAO
MNLKDYADTIESILTSLAILIGGSWTFWKFILQREKYPKIQFDIDINFISFQDEKLLFEIILIIENVGLVRHEISSENFTLRIRYLRKSDKIEQGTPEYNYQTNFHHLHEVIPKSEIQRKIIPESWKNTFIDPGVSQKYSYITSLPDDTICLLVKSKFNYSHRNLDFHGAQKLFKAPSSLDLHT